MQPIEKGSARNIMIFIDAEVVAEANGKIGNPVLLTQEKQEDGMGSSMNVPVTTPAAPAGRQLAGSGAVVKFGHQVPTGNAHIIPIAHLNPYNNNWTIKVRVTSKTDVRSGNKNGRDWRMFKADLLDNAGSEISATFFGDAVSLFFDMIKVCIVHILALHRITVCPICCGCFGCIS